MSRRLPFVKMHGAGNDFVMVDGRDLPAPPTPAVIAALCHRRTGVGADGLIVVAPEPERDFRMIYWNADGGEASMCGNGARCAVEYAARRDLHDGHCTFATASGDLKGRRHGPGDIEVSLPSWRDLALAVEVPDSPWSAYHVCDTGVPHLVIPVDDLEAVPVREWGARLRHHELFAPGGVNVNWIAPDGAPDRFALRTYERGVEDETLACGTGASAAAVIVCHLERADSPVTIRTRGGDELVIVVDRDRRTLSLRGPAVTSFEGEVTIDD
jgi:diaminopimelate epimerase